MNADDFGQSASINDGIVECHEHGILTSASLMVRWPCAARAAAYARRAGALSVGLHIDIGEWTHRDGAWRPLYQVVPLDDYDAIRTEVVSQLDTFRELMGCDPTHIDSHQHVHRWPGVASVVSLIADQIGVPLRQASADIRHIGAFYGQGPKGEALPDSISVEHLIQILTTLPEGVTELGCHPGVRDDAEGMYIVEREQEMKTLCDPRVLATLEAERIELMSFRDIRKPSRQ